MTYIVDFKRWKLFEQEIYTNPGDPYQYKVVDGVWYTKGPKLSTWTSLANNQAAIAKLDKRHPEARKRVDVITPKKPETPVKGQASQPTSLPTATVDTIQLPKEYQSKIDPAKIDPKGGVVCDTSIGHCAAFLKDINQVSYLGNAWTAYSYPVAGQKIWSAFDGVDINVVGREVLPLYARMREDFNKNKYKFSKNGKYTKEVKPLISKIIAAKPFNSPSLLKKGDYVGIFHPSSNFHEIAFWEGSIPGRDAGFTHYFEKNGNPSQSIVAYGNLWSSNTHIGQVYGIVNGTVMIIHAIDNKVRIDPWNRITNGSDRIVWVKRPKKVSAVGAPHSRD